MSAQLGDPLTPNLRDTLSNLAAGLFGLDAWVKEATKYKPPNVDLPWRAAGHTFSPADLAVIPFFENLLRESSGDDDLGVRWDTVAADPLKFSPLLDPVSWRKNRGLNPPKFGIVKSSNVWLTNANGTVISRASFYAPCWPLLKGVVDVREKTGAVDWAALASDLLANKVPEWPTTAQPASSAFLVQFASDMLYAMLGMRTSAPEPWHRAVSIELGEYRRPGNEYSTGDVSKAVKKFEALVGI